MFEEEIRRKIGDFRELGWPAYVPRHGRVLMADRMVSTVVGARRAGKSFRALQMAHEMVERGELASLEQVCPVDFDNPILSGMQARDLGLIQSTLLKMSAGLGLKTPLVFILDEIHKVAGWEQYVIDLSRNPHWKVIVTGSSSKLLRGDLATELRGKALSSTVYPLSFSEFLAFKGCGPRANSTQERADIQRHFEEYLSWGGYPALVPLDNLTKEGLLREYFDTMILKDIIQRSNVSKPRDCVELYRHVLSGIGKPHTLKSAYEHLRLCGCATSRDAVRDYLGWAEDAWLLFIVPIHSDSHKEQERNYKKLYCIDWGLAVRNSRVWDGSYSRAFENMIFLHLRRTFARVGYYRTRAKRQEVDFLATGHQGQPVLAIQVCMDISARDTLQRELDPLVSTARYFGIRENMILTLNQEDRFEQGGVTVHARPAWRWLLEQGEAEP
ncbi:MAG: ATP-binding protein [Kiritimatiellae bacterium]|nr:ATP-binding protein [Kiritimatiellia bacterium]